MMHTSRPPPSLSSEGARRLLPIDADAEAANVDPIVTRGLKLPVAGVLCTAFLAVPESEPWRSAVVVIGEHPTVDAAAMEVARRLALAGHGALAMGHGGLAPEGTEVAELTRGVDAALVRLREEAAAKVPRVGVVGYGAGGFLALVAGYRCQVGAAVSVYGDGPMRLRADLRRIIDRPKRHSAPFLCLLGMEDAAARPADLAAIRERLDAYRMRHTFILYPRTRAGFCEVGNPDHRPVEAADAWTKILHAIDTAPRLRNRTPPRTRT